MSVCLGGEGVCEREILFSISEETWTEGRGRRGDKRSGVVGKQGATGWGGFQPLSASELMGRRARLGNTVCAGALQAACTYQRPGHQPGLRL